MCMCIHISYHPNISDCQLQMVLWGVLKMWDSQVTMGFNTKMVSLPVMLLFHPQKTAGW